MLFKKLSTSQSMKLEMFYQSPHILVFIFLVYKSPKSGNHWSEGPAFPLSPLFFATPCPLHAKLPLQLALHGFGDCFCLSPYMWGHVSLTVAAIVIAWGACGGVQTFSSLYHSSVITPSTRCPRAGQEALPFHPENYSLAPCWEVNRIWEGE